MKKVVAGSDKVKIQIFVYAGDEKIRHTSHMRGEWGYDFKCSCGYESRTGGAVKSYVRDLIDRHKIEDHGYQTEYSYKSISGEIVKI
jgi:hypothetical protein